MSDPTATAAATPAPSSMVPAAASLSPSMEKWSTIVQTPALVEYFSDVFSKAGVVVEATNQSESNEEFTVVNDGRGFAFHAGVDNDVEFVVPLKEENVENLLKFAADGKFDPHESWRIVQILFTPLTRAALQSPAVRRNWLRVMAGVEPIIHVHLVDPNGGEAVRHTLAYAGDQWLVIPGLHGNAGRTYWLAPEQALAFQRQLYKSLKDDTLGGWWQFSNWYREWRKTVSSPG
jgi:hypothetical protein